MNITAQRIKLYSAPKEGEEIRSVVAFRKHHIATEYEFDEEKSRIYHYRVRINLWLVVLDFAWDKKLSTPKK